MRPESRCFGLVFSALLAGGLVTGATTPARAAVPQTVTFTAYVDDAGVPLDGTHAFEFRLYLALPPNPLIWAESRALDVVEGKVDVELGAVESLAGVFTGMPLELEVVVDGTVLAPRTRVASVPYALRAELAESVVSFGGLAPDDYQRRVTGACGGGQAIQSIAADGSAICAPEPGDIFAVDTPTSGGLKGGVASGSATLGLRNCAEGQILRNSAAAGWSCSSDNALAGQCATGSFVTGFDAVTGLAQCTAFVEVGDISGINAYPGGGLLGTTTSGTANIGLLNCAPNEVLVRGIVGWQCGLVGPATIAGLAPDSVTALEIAEDAVGSSEIDDGSIAAADLASGSVTSAKIGNGQVTTSKIAFGAVGATEIGLDAVGMQELNAPMGQGRGATEALNSGNDDNIAVGPITFPATGYCMIVATATVFATGQPCTTGTDPTVEAIYTINSNAPTPITDAMTRLPYQHDGDSADDQFQAWECSGSATVSSVQFVQQATPYEFGCRVNTNSPQKLSWYCNVSYFCQ